jgi:transcriptional regulator with XRE-family HTH domain
MRRSTEPDFFLKSFGEVLRNEREGQKLSQQCLSVGAGLAANVVGDLERGKRRIHADEIARLCLVLDVPVSTFLAKVTLAQIQAVQPLEEELRAQAGLREGTSRSVKITLPGLPCTIEFSGIQEGRLTFFNREG